MPAPLDLSDQIFGDLRVSHRTRKDRTGAWMWLCRCSCGTEIEVRGATLKARRTSACASCGAIRANTTHGASGTPLYARWRSMLERTGNPNRQEFHNYGGRGIAVCPSWRTFEGFASDMGSTFSPELEIDRIDVDGDYEPTNCRWVTRDIQQRNRRNNHRVTWHGRTMVVTDWAEMLGIKPNTLIYRLKRGWSIDRALSTGASPTVLLALANGGVA